MIAPTLTAPRPAPVAAPATTPAALPPGWRSWHSPTPRYARRLGRCWADVLRAPAGGWHWRITRGVHVIATGRARWATLAQMIAKADAALERVA